MNARIELNELKRLRTTSPGKDIWGIAYDDEIVVFSGENSGEAFDYRGIDVTGELAYLKAWGSFPATFLLPAKRHRRPVATFTHLSVMLLEGE